MSDDDKDISELVERLSDVIQEARDFARAAYGHDFDQARRNIPPDATGLEIDRLKDPYALEFLGLEPLPGDPTIEDMERLSADDDPPEPEEIEETVNEVILDAEKLNDAARAVLTARVDGEWRHSEVAYTRAVFSDPRLLEYLGLDQRTEGEA